jgi:predicted nucleotidyltransferase
MFDLPDRIKFRIINTLSKESTVEKAILFGSRARGNCNSNSDIDLALVGYGIPLSLNTKLREAAGLYSLDIVRIEGLDNDSLMSNIIKDGVVIYGKEESVALLE